MKTETRDSQVKTTDEDVMALARRAFQHARAGEAAQLEWLLGVGLPANLSNERGDTLLMLASYHGHLAATGVLLEYGADPERTNDRGQTPLSGAAFKGDLSMARLLLSRGARVDGAGPDGKTALMFAAMFDKIEVLEELLARGADFQRQDAARRRAIDYAQTMGAERTSARLASLLATRQ
ncbi:ankyrin repeat domain-containing protein [Melittangium boletus]|uniref:ankyrin repeat domain-containing protein n=1 Tax=Melittangium boletus TaxID=83453 RepID=UPI003DA37AF7